jgi:hypothetical protein
MPGTGRMARPRPRKSSPEQQLRRKAQTLGKKAVETLAQLMLEEKTPATIRLAAAREVLDRGHGRPKLGAGEQIEAGGMTVIVKRYSDVTEEEKARAEEGEP